MRWVFYLLPTCLLSLGCGSGGPFDYVKVSGQVTYEDESPIPNGEMRLVFTPLEMEAVGTAHPRPGIANVNAEGEFDCVTSYKYGDGLVPGKHKVVVQAASEQDGRPIIPKECTNVTTTPLVIDTADAPLKIRVPKP